METIEFTSEVTRLLDFDTEVVGGIRGVREPFQVEGQRFRFSDGEEFWVKTPGGFLIYAMEHEAEVSRVFEEEATVSREIEYLSKIMS